MCRLDHDNGEASNITRWALSTEMCSVERTHLVRVLNGFACMVNRCQSEDAPCCPCMGVGVSGTGLEVGPAWFHDTFLHTGLLEVPTLCTLQQFAVRSELVVLIMASCVLVLIIAPDYHGTVFIAIVISDDEAGDVLRFACPCPLTGEKSNRLDAVMGHHALRCLIGVVIGDEHHTLIVELHFTEDCTAVPQYGDCTLVVDGW